MAFIDTTPPERAAGRLRGIYDAATQRAGRVYKIIELQSPNPQALAASLQLYMAIVHGSSPLSRVEREALAVTVSRANDCFY